MCCAIAKGSLEFETFAPHALFEGEQVVAIEQQVQNRARQLIEEIMIAAIGCNARYLARSGHGSLRRVVRSPERWLRIVEVARQYGEVLPPTLIPGRWRTFWRPATGPILCDLPICRW